MSLSTIPLFRRPDDLSRTIEEWERHRLIPTARRRCRPGKTALSGTLFIMVLFHLFPFRDFRHFLIHGVEQKYRRRIGALPSYGRLVSLMPRLFIPFRVLLHSLRGRETGVYVADSTRPAVCDNLSTVRNRVFEGLARRGKTTMGWFHGFKLHMVINHRGEIMAVRTTPGNIDDRAGSSPTGGTSPGSCSTGSGRGASRRSPASAATCATARCP